jgi:ATP-dependent Lhr-like helicase
MALAARLRDSLGRRGAVALVRRRDRSPLPRRRRAARARRPLVEPQELEDLVVQEVGSTALFGARFRENAARAL